MRNEIIFENGRRVWADSDITPKVITILQEQFESQVIEVNRKPVTKYGIIKAKHGIKTPNQQYASQRKPGKEVAKRMRNFELLKGFADKVEKMDFITAKQIEEIIPDYVPGWEIRKAFLGDQEKYPSKKWLVSYIDVYSKGKKIEIELGRVSDKEDVKQALKRRGDVREVLSITEITQAKKGKKIENPNAISWETFEEKYNPQINHILKEKYPKDDPTELTGWGGIMYETYGDEYDYVREIAQKHPKRVWTLVDGDNGELVIIAGWHYVNRMNYVITEKPWNTGDEYVDDEMAKHGAKTQETRKVKFQKIGVEINDIDMGGDRIYKGTHWLNYEKIKDMTDAELGEWILNKYLIDYGNSYDYEIHRYKEYREKEVNIKPTQAKQGAETSTQLDLELPTDTTGVKYRAEVGGIGENRWSGNAMEYDTEDEAKDWLRGLASRWFGYNISRVVPVSVPKNQDIDLSDPLMFQNYRKNAKGTKIRTNSVAVKELIKDLENTPYGVGLALLRERLLTHADYDLKKHNKNPKTFENPIFSVGMYEDLFKRIHKELNFDVSKNNVKAVKDLIKDLANTPHEVGLALLRERMVAYAENDLEVLKDNPKVFDNPIYNSGMYKDLFNRMIKFCDFKIGKKGMKTEPKSNNVTIEDYLNNSDVKQWGVYDSEGILIEDGFHNENDAVTWANENGYDTDVIAEKKPIIDIGSDNIAKRGAKTQGVEWDKDSDSIRTQLGEFRVTITPQMEKGYYDVYVSANKKQIGKKYDVYGLENAKDIAFSMISNANKVAEGDMVGSDNTRYPRKADDTGKGIMEGWVIGDGNAYYEKEENALKSVKELGYKTIEEAYDNDEIYFTDWHDEDLDEQGYYYTANGKEVQISSKGSKLGGMERENADMVLNNNKQISHHTKELASAVKGKSVPAWVVAKVNRSATDLSDATHYLEGTEKAKRGAKTKSKGFMVFNYTDDIYASPDTFLTKAKANEFITQFRKRFEGQGYYRDNRMNKVAPKDIDLLAIPEEFNPYKKN